MYTNNVILQFKKTAKWVQRATLWLDQQTGVDGELKDPACKNISELIVSLLTMNYLSLLYLQPLSLNELC